jgi:phosphate/sulfate permease
MRLKFAIPVAFATACLPFATAVHAANYTETGDAGDLPATAQVTTTSLGPLTPLTSITGQTTQTNEISDSDMYEVFITGTTAFTASTTAFVAGANNFDDQIALFNAAGVGIATNDDAANGGDQSSLTVAATSLLAGDYYLLISGSGRYAVDSSGNLIFPNFTDGTTDPSGTYGPSSTNPIAGYTGNSNEAGSYVIAISGAQFAALVPEPSSLAAIVAGAGGLALVLRRRRS